MNAENLKQNENSFKIEYKNGYQKRKNKEIFQLLLLDNRKSIRGFTKVAKITSILLIAWLLVPNILILIALIPFLGLVIIGIIGYVGIWRHSKKYERSEIPHRAYIEKRTLKYGDYGIVYYESGTQGGREEKYAWKRYQSILKWEEFLILTPAIKKADFFIIRKDEIGEDGFDEFKKFASTKLEYKLIEDWKGVIF